MTNVFPWCENIWKNLLTSVNKKRLPHAILFYGNAGLGKSELAFQFSQYLLCSEPNKKEAACGVCKDCVLFLAKTHGDFYFIFPEEMSKSIGVDQIRNMKAAAQQKSQRNNVKVFLMPHAEKMTIAASNALLKILEEPPGDTVFMLTTEEKHFLSPTILSRCHHYGLSTSSSEKTERWLLENTQHAFTTESIKQALKWALGAPLLARQLLESNKIAEYTSYAIPLVGFFSGQETVFSLVKLWQGKPLADILYVAQITCYYVLKGEWAGNFNKTIIYQWIEKIIKIKKRLATHIALNEGLVFDTLLVP